MINIRELLLHIGKWLISLIWLFLCATVTTPHAVSSRYPAKESIDRGEMGSQHYGQNLGVVACIGPLANHTEMAVKNLIAHFQQIQDSYYQMIR